MIDSLKLFSAAGMIFALGIAPALAAEYLGEIVKGTLTMVDGDTITINGCKGALCQKFELSRI